MAQGKISKKQEEILEYQSTTFGAWFSACSEGNLRGGPFEIHVLGSFSSRNA